MINVTYPKLASLRMGKQLSSNFQFTESTAETEQRAKGAATEEAATGLERRRRRRGGGAEARVKPKMGSPEYKELSGGGGAAREAPWRRGDDERRPAVGTNGGDGARVGEGEK